MLRFRTSLLFVCILFSIQEVSAAPIRITDFRFSGSSEKIRVVFDANGPISYELEELSNKIVLNIKEAKLIGLLNKTWLYKTPISTIQGEQLGKNLRITLDLKKSVQLQHFVLQNPHRLVLDFPEKKETTTTQQQPSPVISATSPPVVADQSESSKQFNVVEEKTDYLVNRCSRDVVIVIDPGHGGRDPGAIGHAGTREKDVALAVSKALQKAINKYKGFRVVLTRNGDYFISLRQRLGIAHCYKADMFIAVHADAFKNTATSHGVSIFALSQRGATSEAARWLAEKENESELGLAISDKNLLLRSVLIDLAQAATISTSLEVGEVLLRKLNRITHLHSRRVEQAGFVVLKSPDIPSLLVETGFISDPYEERRLRESNYQRKIAECLAVGITSYFAYRPPQGTYLAKIKQKANSRSWQ